MGIPIKKFLRHICGLFYGQSCSKNWKRLLNTTKHKKENNIKLIKKILSFSSQHKIILTIKTKDFNIIVLIVKNI